jgi:hypothetical protein
MSSLSRGSGAGVPLDAEARSQLEERVSNSALFQRSHRLRELFVYLCHAAPGAVTEHRIGVDVFRRQPDYDSSADTIARVQVSQLRKKLQEFFLAEGASEPVIIEIPKGSYTPVFREREQPPGRMAVTPGSGPVGVSASPWRSPGVLAVLVSALGLVALMGMWLVRQNEELSKSVASLGPNTPALDQFWQTLFPGGQNVQIVLADANLMIISDLMDGHLVSLSEYRSRTYPADLINSLIPDSRMRAVADHISGTHLTTEQDAEAIRAIVPLSIRYRFPTTVVFARDFRIQSAPGSLILIGHKKGNPWVELFEPRMNFRYEYVFIGTEFRGVLVNQSPLPGEEKRYVVDYEKNGYALVAYLPKPVGEGTALLLSGTDMSSIAASSRFIADPRSVGQLLDHLKVRQKDRIPYFEVLLRTKLLINTAPQFEILAYRTPKI